MVAHLADCPSCFEVFSEAAQFQFEEEEEEAEAPDPPEAVAPPEAAVVVPFSKKKVPLWLGSIAAVLLVGLAAVFLYRSAEAMPEMVTADLVTPKLASAVTGGDFWNKGDYRGNSKDLSASTPAEFMIGAHLVDLRLALTNNDSSSSLNVLSRILGLIDGIYFSESQRKLADSMHSRIYKGEQPSKLLPEAGKLEAGLAEICSSALTAGKWAEAGRLSARAGQPGLFEDRDSRKLVRWLLQNRDNENVALAPEVVQDLERIQQILKADPAELPYGELDQHLTDILRHYQAEADVH
jgi:hypothetical protein